LGTVAGFAVPGDVWDLYSAAAVNQVRQWWEAHSYYRLGLTEEDAVANELAYRVSTDTMRIFTPCDGLQVASTLAAVEFLGDFGESKVALNTAKAMGYLGAVGAVASLGCD
jgi:hypothetical protein